jgi:hypothetical protein
MTDQQKGTNEKGDTTPIRPTGRVVSEEEQKLEYFASAPLRSANRLMKLLYGDDQFYETATHAWVGSGDAKKLFLYGACKEVMKTSIEMLEGKDHLKEGPEDANSDQMTKLVLCSFIDSQTYRVRKLVELLSILILFDRNRGRDEEYRVFLNAETLDLELSRLKDFRELYDGKVVANMQHGVDEFVERIENDLGVLGVTALWFLDRQKVMKREPSVFTSRRQMFLRALEVATPDERLALGISYGRGYSQASQALHPLLGSHDYGKNENTLQRLRSSFVYLGLLGMHVMHLSYRLAGVNDPEGIDKVMGKDFEKSDASKFIQRLQKEFAVGDIVLTAWTDIAEILEVHISNKYGYRAYRVKYISRAPIPEVPDDWIESAGILLRLMAKSQIRSIYEKAVTDESYPKAVQEIMPEILKMPDEELIQYAGKTFLDLHKAGVLIPMLLEQGALKRTDTST